MKAQIKKIAFFASTANSSGILSSLNFTKECPKQIDYLFANLHPGLW